MKKLLIFSVFQMWIAILLSQDVTLTTQAQVNAFNQTTLSGTLTVEGDDIVDLSPLNNLEKIGEGLIIQNCPFLLEVNGFESLDSVGIIPSFVGNFYSQSNGIQIVGNTNLKIVSAFPNLDFAWKIEIHSNENLERINFESTKVTLFWYWSLGSIKTIQFGDFTVANNESLETVSGSFDCAEVTCSNNINLVNLKDISFASGLRSLVLKDNPLLENTPEVNSVTYLSEFVIKNTAIDSLNQFQSLETVGGDWYGEEIIKHNRFLKSIELPNLTNGHFLIDSNSILDKISMPNLSCINSFQPDISFGKFSIRMNEKLDSIFIGTQCTSSNCFGSGVLEISENQNLRTIEIFKYVSSLSSVGQESSYSIFNNPNLNSLKVGQNVSGSFENNPNLELDSIYYSIEEYEIFWSEAPETFTIDCTADSIQSLNNLFGNWFDMHTFHMDCRQLNYFGNFWFNSDYAGPGLYPIEIYVPFAYGDTIRKMITFEVLDISMPDLIQSPQPFDYLCDGDIFQSELDDWLENLGYAILSPVCIDLIWSNDFTILAPEGQTLVVFTATDADGEFITSFEGVVNNLDNDATVGILQFPSNLEVVCDNTLSYQQQIYDWLSNNGGAEVIDPCFPVTWTNDYDLDFSVGSNQVSFEAFSETGVILNESTTLTILPGEESPILDDEPEQLTLFENDPILEVKIQAWLNNQGGAEALHNCGTFDWAHNYDFDYSVGNHFVTFTATADNGQSVETTGLLAIQDCLGQWTNNQPQELTVQCDQNGNYIDQVDQWLLSNAGLMLNSDCDEVEWSNDWEGSYDTGNYWVTFTASGATSAFEYSRGAFLSIQRGDAAPMITTEPSDLTLLSNDQALESSIAVWLLSNGGAEAIDNCGTFTWSNNYSGQTEPGVYPVTFTATADNGSTAQTTATLTIELASSVEEESESNIIIAPNPVENVLTVTTDKAMQQISIMSLDGRVLYLQVANANQASIDTSHLLTGIYLVSAEHNDGSRVVRRIVKE